jgi:uncharacterized protein (TIGR02453 family)
MSKSIIPFLKELKKNNNKEWFEANKKQFEKAKAELSVVVQELIDGIKNFEPGVAGILAKDTMFRIYRDIRFSNDKTPYKTNMGAWISPGGKKSTNAGYYIHIEPGNSFLAGGKHMPEGDELKAIRQEIDYNLDEFNKILNAPEYKKLFGGTLDGDKLKTVPKGYDASNPAIEHLKMKSFIAYRKLADKDIDSKDLMKDVLHSFKAMKPLNDFLNRAIGKE